MHRLLGSLMLFSLVATCAAEPAPKLKLAIRRSQSASVVCSECRDHGHGEATTLGPPKAKQVDNGKVKLCRGWR